MLCSIPALIIAFWLIFLPETPKYLAESGQNFQLLNILGDIYVKNTNKPVETYFVSNPFLYTIIINFKPLRVCDNLP